MADVPRVVQMEVRLSQVISPPSIFDLVRLSTPRAVVKPWSTRELPLPMGHIYLHV